MRVWAIVALVALVGCGDDGGTVRDAGIDGSEPDAIDGAIDSMGHRTLNPAFAWYGSNRQTLDTFVEATGSASATYDPQHRPVAVFSIDDTLFKNSVTDATLFWMLKHSKVIQPPNKNWRLTSPWLTTSAATALGAACGALAAAGSPLPTATNDACAKEILTIYLSRTTTGSQAAFDGWNFRRMEPARAWAAQLTAGYTAAESTAFAEAALVQDLAAAQDATQTIGTVTVTAWLRLYDQMNDLVGTLRDEGFDVWIASSGPQAWAEAAALRVGVAADHVIGARSVIGNAKLTYNLIGCGGVPDGTNDGAGTFTGNSLIPHIDGSRCWINKVIYGDATASALTKTADASLRPAFAAGVTDGDVISAQDATKLKLVLNRNRPEIMCNAYDNEGNAWIINPLFIEPRPQQSAAYPCATTACKDSVGTSTPCIDENGQPIADQSDSVF